MADQNPVSPEERIVTSTWVHERHNTGDTLDTVSAKFEERFKKNPPICKTMSKWESKLFKTGSAKDASRSGRPVKRRESCKNLEQSIINSPFKSTGKDQQNLVSREQQWCLTWKRTWNLINPAMLRKTSHITWRRIMLCRESERQHIEVLDAWDKIVGMDHLLGGSPRTSLATRPKKRSHGFCTIGDVMPSAFHFARSTLSLCSAPATPLHRRRATPLSNQEKRASLAPMSTVTKREVHAAPASNCAVPVCSHSSRWNGACKAKGSIERGSN